MDFPRGGRSVPPVLKKNPNPPVPRVNKSKPCQYEALGCKFKHEISPQCYYQNKCRVKLCQFKHLVAKTVNVTHGINDDEGETSNNHEKAILNGFIIDMKLFPSKQIEYGYQDFIRNCNQCEYETN